MKVAEIIKRRGMLVGLILSLMLPLLGFGSLIFLHLLVLFCIYSLLAFSIEFPMTRLRAVPFGWGAAFGIGAYTSALLATKFGWPVIGCIFLGVLASTLLGLVLGLITMKMRGSYFAIFSMVLLLFLQIVCVSWDNVTGGPAGVIGIPPISIGGLKLDTPFSFSFAGILAVWLVIFVIRRLTDSPWGRAVKAVGRNEVLAQSLSIHIAPYWVGTLSVAAAMCGLSGALYAHYFGAVGPTQMGLYYSLVALAAVIIGGGGTVGGPIAGTLFWVFVPEMLRMSGEMRMVIMGLAMVACMLFVRQGIWALAVSGFKKLGLTGRVQSQA